MAAQLRRWHMIIAALTLALFAYTGIYLRMNLPALYHGDEAVHMMYRANHIYLLMAGLVHTGEAIYLRPTAAAAGQRWQWIGSLGQTLAVVLFAIAFWRDPARDDMVRPFTSLAVLALVLGLLCHIIAQRR